MVPILLLLVYASLNYSRQILSNQVNQLENEVNFLKAEAAPLIDLNSYIAEAERKAILIAKITTEGEPYHVILNQIITLAPLDINISDITIDKNGIMEISGKCPDMQTIAAYQYSMDTAKLFVNSELAAIKMNSDNSYSFKIIILLNDGDINYGYQD